MSESANYDPSPWRGHIDHFASARKAYDASRTYVSASSVDKDSVKIEDYVPPSLSTDVQVPIVVVLDATGSMGNWFGIILSKLPYLDNELKEYFGEGRAAVSFCCIDDVGCHPIPLQVRGFVQGTAMKDELEKLKHTNAGGGNMEESYDLAALYYARNCEMPKAIKPIIIFIGDEGLYDWCDRDHGAKFAHVTLDKRTSVPDVFEELKSKFSVYAVHKPYGDRSGDTMDSTNQGIYEEWTKLLGDDHVAILPVPERIMDVLFGIFAAETGKVDYFVKELKDRQLPDKDGDKKVKIVLKSLATIHHDPDAIAKDPSLKKLPAPSKKGQSVSRGRTGGTKSKSLMD